MHDYQKVNGCKIILGSNIPKLSGTIKEYLPRLLDSARLPKISKMMGNKFLLLLFSHSQHQCLFICEPLDQAVTISVTFDFAEAISVTQNLFLRI